MPPTQLTCFSDEFVISAGCVLFRFQDGKEEICVLHQRKKDEWVLPKGRKDRGESVEITALRETYEETGYRCRYLPTDLYTRAPIAGLSMNEEATEAKGSTSEPFAVSIRDADESGRIKKIVWWFIAEVVGEHQKGTQMPTEDFESVFLNADEAIIKLTRETDRDAVKRAVGLVRRTRTNCQLEAST
ncbi:hypothetical protein FRC03_005486 [Tulasnella sp. 419]|nr:hypothetical protein FRC03_005486 [Tulasnella sp. 419]